MQVVQITSENYPAFQGLVQWRVTGNPNLELPEPSPDALAFTQREDYWLWAAQLDGRFVGWISYVLIPKPDERVGNPDGGFQLGYAVGRGLWNNPGSPGRLAPSGSQIHPAGGSGERKRAAGRHESQISTTLQSLEGYMDMNTQRVDCTNLSPRGVARAIFKLLPQKTPQSEGFYN